MKILPFLIVLILSINSKAQDKKPLRIGVVGLVHSHVHWILGREDRGDIEIVGIAEPNTELAQRFAVQHGYSMDIVYSTIDEMIEQSKPEAVTAFNTIFGHLEVVQKCAPKGVHVMVEKPLAVSLDHAKQMESLARKHEILLLTNYETTWYPTTQHILKQETINNFGGIRKVVVHDGHQGPEEIGVNKEFLEWLIDPKWNGAGALTDFGCYGANLITAVMGNQRPQTVTAITQTIKPEKYPKVDDEATIILTYPKAQGIIQASWNWTFSRKDWEVYGTDSYIRTTNGTTLDVRIKEDQPERTLRLKELTAPKDDPFAYLAAAVRGDIKTENDLNSLENNMIVMEILDAAMRSSKSGKTIVLK